MAEYIELSGLSGRQLKKKVRQLLASDADINDILEALAQISARTAVNPLFACFYDGSLLVKWRAVAGMGFVVARLAEQEMESARVVMRRLMWNLNDESGGIGWGSPEAMAEIMARQPKLADEYGAILGSYVRRDQNFLEHEGLQRGSIWGVGRLAEVRPALLQDTVGDLRLFLTSPDPCHRGYAAWSLGNLGAVEAVPEIEALLADNSEIDMFRDLALVTTHVSRLAKEALAAIENGKGSC
ncbi:MAG: DVU0298 family protein [Desulfobacterales bacterium]